MKLHISQQQTRLHENIGMLTNKHNAELQPTNHVTKVMGKGTVFSNIMHISYFHRSHCSSCEKTHKIIYHIPQTLKNLLNYFHRICRKKYRSNAMDSSIVTSYIRKLLQKQKIYPFHLKKWINKIENFLINGIRSSQPKYHILQ